MTDLAGEADVDWIECVWFLALLLTGIAAGALAGHALLLGRFLAWFFQSGRIDLFRETYPPFLQAKKPERFFDSLFTAALLATAAFNTALFEAGRACFLALAALGLQGLFVAVFFGTGFGALERDLFTKADTAPEQVKRFLSLNTPVLALSALLLAASFGCLAWIRP